MKATKEKKKLFQGVRERENEYMYSKCRVLDENAEQKLW